MSSGKRSTLVELRRILSENGDKLDRKLRPASREAARTRAAWLRTVRNRRARKAHLRTRTSMHAESLGSALFQSPTNTSPSSDSSFELMDVHHHNSSDTSVETSSDWDACSVEGGQDRWDVSSIDHEHEHVRLSWVRQLFPEGSGKRPTSSMLCEIRSLLSWHSIRGSQLSRLSSRYSLASSASLRSKSPDSTVFPVEPQKRAMRVILDPSSWDTYPEVKARQYNSLIMTLCCGGNRGCLHRKLLATINPIEEPNPAGGGKLTADDYTLKGGRDALNETVLHIAARWGVSSPQMATLINQCSRQALGAKNIAGETFLEVRARECFLTCPQLLVATMLEADKCGVVYNTSYESSYGNPNLFASLILRANIKDAALGPEEREKLSTSFRTILQSPRDDLHRWLGILDCHGQSVAYGAAEFLEALAEDTEDYYTREPYLVISKIYRGLLVQRSPEPGLVPQTPDSDAHRLHTELEALSNLTACTIDASHPFLVEESNLNEYNRNHMTSIMIVIDRIRSGHLLESIGADLISLFIRCGADTALVDGYGNTPLHNATSLELSDVTSVLIDNGAKVMAYNAAGQTTLKCAVGLQYFMNSVQGSTGADGGNSSKLSRKTYPRVQKALVRIFDSISRRQAQNQGQHLAQVPEEPDS